MFIRQMLILIGHPLGMTLLSQKCRYFADFRLRRLRGLWEIPRGRTRNAQVNGSNPFAGSRFIEGLVR